jgi:hypothetical protein
MAMIAEYYRFAEENLADSRVFFRIGVKFREHARLRGAGGTHDATVSVGAGEAGDPDPGFTTRMQPSTDRGKSRS